MLKKYAICKTVHSCKRQADTGPRHPQGYDQILWKGRMLTLTAVDNLSLHVQIVGKRPNLMT